MVNSLLSPHSPRFRQLSAVVGACVVVVAATLVALAVLAWLAPDQATTEAWVHALIVAFFAVLLPLRLRAAARGSARALDAVGIIAGALVVVNLVEAALPGLFPVWMRVEMLVIAALAGWLMTLVVRRRA